MGPYRRTEVEGFFSHRVPRAHRVLFVDLESRPTGETLAEQKKATIDVGLTNAAGLRGADDRSTRG